jgi:hypothetical protein
MSLEALGINKAGLVYSKMEPLVGWLLIKKLIKNK